MTPEEAAFVATLRAQLAPTDRVPRAQLTREDVERAAAMTGHPVRYTIPGEMILDADGMPAGMSEPETGTAIATAVTITRAEADRLGITRGEIPNVNIV